MLILYNKNALPKDKEDIKFPWDTYFRGNKITNYLDETDEKIVEDVEKTSIINNNTIHGKFSNMAIGIGCLSDGCKTMLCINHAIKTNTTDKYIFNISDCGRNAVKYLIEEIANDIDVHAYIEHYSLGLSRNCQLKVGDKMCNSTTEASKELIRLQEEDYDEGE